MSLEETRAVDAITIRETGQIEVRTATVVRRDGEEIARSYHRHVLAPGDDIAGQDARVAAVANVVWTPELIAAHQAAQSA